MPRRGEVWQVDLTWMALPPADSSGTLLNWMNPKVEPQRRATTLLHRPSHVLPVSKGGMAGQSWLRAERR
jgi:hypothetical protein